MRTLLYTTINTYSILRSPIWCPKKLPKTVSWFLTRHTTSVALHHHVVCITHCGYADNVCIEAMSVVINQEILHKTTGNLIKLTREVEKCVCARMYCCICFCSQMLLPACNMYCVFKPPYFALPNWRVNPFPLGLEWHGV